MTITRLCPARVKTFLVVSSTNMEQINIPSGNTSGDISSPEPKKSGKSELFSLIGILILAPIIAIFLTSFIFQSYKVDGPSMEKTLYDNDRLIVWKGAKSWSRLKSGSYIPDRFSIIIFNSPASNGVDSGNKQLIKRVIGLPGDQVVIKDGIVTIFNQENPDGFFPDRTGPESNVIGITSGNINYTVKDDEVFVLGDNRDNSLDSRSFGAVKSDVIIGSLSVRIFPFDKIQKY